MHENGLILELLKRPIAYHPIVAKAFDSVNLAVMWSQLYYWSSRTDDRDGWIYKTSADMLEETGLTRRQQDTARQIGEKLGVLEAEVRGTPPVMHYRVNIEKSVEVIQAYRQKLVTPALFATAIEPKEETPGQFAKRFFNGEDDAAKEEIRAWLIEKGVWNETVRGELRKFIMHWTEPTKTGKRQLWETKPTFEIRRRIATWLENAGKWNKSTVKPRGGMVL